MNRGKIRLRIARLWRWPQSAGQRLSTLYQRIPAQIRFFSACAILALLTALLISRYPLSLVPQYRPGDIVNADLVIPAGLELQTANGARQNVTNVETGSRRRILLQAGDTVTEEVLPQLAAVRRFQLEQRQPGRLLGFWAIAALFYFALYKAATNSQSSRLAPRAAFWVASTALLMQTVLVRAGMFGAAVLSARPETMRFGEFLEFQFAIPFAACALVLSLLVGAQMALIAGLMSALLTAFLSPQGAVLAVFALAGSVTAVYSGQRYRDRNAVTWACALIGLVNMAMSLAVILVTGSIISWNIVVGIVMLGVMGALLTAGIASFAVPIYESAFDILTDMKLLELSNADLPLLRRLAIETPGTNHHSFMVGVLAESAAKAIGANALLARIGCLYHDIGKLAAPKMYIENQAGAANPHDKVSPLDSVRIITGHVRRGIQMGREADLPQQIIDFIPQHHGTRILAYFYHKAKAEAERRGETVSADTFRYPGPKPQTKEAVILMLADGCEAAVRSLDEHTPENIQAIVKKIVDTVISDGQMDESDLTLRELTIVRETLVSTLSNVYHHRISYPGFNPPSQVAKEAPPGRLADFPTPQPSAAQAHGQ